MTSTGTISTVTRADHVPGPPQGHWTYDDYLAIPDDGRRYEILGGVLYLAPAPNLSHQQMAYTLYRRLAERIEDTDLGRVFGAPTDVKLLPTTVLQPDVLVVLNANTGERLAGTLISGAPDLVVEVLSPGNSTYDRRKKRREYAEAGIPEYWIADPKAWTIELLLLENYEYRSLGIFQGGNFLPSAVVPNFEVPVRKFFD